MLFIVEFSDLWCRQLKYVDTVMTVEHHRIYDFQQIACFSLSPYRILGINLGKDFFGFFYGGVLQLDSPHTLSMYWGKKAVLNGLKLVDDNFHFSVNYPLNIVGILDVTKSFVQNRLSCWDLCSRSSVFWGVTSNQSQSQACLFVSVPLFRIVMFVFLCNMWVCAILQSGFLMQTTLEF